MSTRMIRTLALAAGAGALVLGAAAPAMAADTSVDKLPAKVNVDWRRMQRQRHRPVQPASADGSLRRVTDLAARQDGFGTGKKAIRSCRQDHAVPSASAVPD